MLNAPSKTILLRIAKGNPPEIWLVVADLDDSKTDHPVVVLEWGNCKELTVLQSFPLFPELIHAKAQADSTPEYSGPPIPIPADLWPEPKPLTVYGQNRGFLERERLA